MGSGSVAGRRRTSTRRSDCDRLAHSAVARSKDERVGKVSLLSLVFICVICSILSGTFNRSRCELRHSASLRGRPEHLVSLVARPKLPLGLVHNSVM